MNNILKLLAFLALVWMCGAQDKVLVGVYYETKCPDCIVFIANQLWPTYQRVSEIFSINFVPFGNAHFTPNGSRWNFTCQHGPAECDGNRIHACAIKYYPFSTDIVPFVSCTMSQRDPPKASQMCASQGGLNWTTISSCGDGIEGSNLLHDNGVLTQSLSPQIYGVPWVVINNKWTQENQDRSETDFLGLVCDTYTGPVPAACPTA